MAFGQDQGSFLLNLTDFRKMGHYRRNSLKMYPTLVVEEIAQRSHFELQETYMLDTFLQFGLLLKAQVIPFGSPEYSQLQILIRVIPIVFKCNFGAI